MILEFIGNAPRNNFLRLGVSGNNLVDDLVFIIGRKQGKNDLYEFTPKIKITTAERDFAEYSGDDLTVEKIEERDTIKITYVLPEIVTERGNVDMLIVFEKAIDGGKVKAWQTLPFNVTFPDGIDESDSIIEAYPNIVRELKADTKKAVEDSSAAVSTANTAKSTADDAKTASDNAVATANKAKATADSVTDAEANRVSAESARASAEAARVTAENLRSTAEGTRKTNEDARKASETARASAEAARVSAESVRTDSEESREFAESIRTTNESARKSAESARTSAESTRVSNENTRKNNETARGTAEVARADAEGKRGTAETARANAESARASAESTRKTNETARGTAETARASAEASRVSAESSRVEAENKRAEAENARAATLAAKLDKKTNDGKKTEAYVFNGEEQSAAEVTNTPTASAIPTYNANNNLKTDKPIDPDDCVRKVDIANLIEGTDKYFAALLNDTNTTETFKAWYNAANDGEVTRYALLERFFRMLALNNDQTHTVRFYSSAVSSDSKGTPLDWLADKKAQVLATDAGVVENANSWLDADGVTRKDGEDWATENRITWYVRANALSLDDGTMDVLAIEGVDDTFDITGNLAPVYSFQLSPWYKETDDGEYLIKSWRANYAEGYAPFNNNVDFDGNPRALTWHASFGGVMTDDGTKLTSGAHRRPKNYTSSTAALTLARKWNANEAVGADANAKWALSEWQHRHFNKENSDIANGCLSYNFQHNVSVAEAGVMRVIVTTAQMSSYVIGANVIVGDNAATTAPDRGVAAAYNLSKHAVKVLSVETVEIGGTSYGAVNLDLDEPITTTATTWVSSAPWDTGATEDIAGNHLDGSPVSLTSAKYPLRVAGMEVLIGAYFIGIDVLYNVTANPSGGYDYAVFECRDSAKIAGSITADYLDTGIRLEGVASSWQYVKDFVNTNSPVLFPQTLGGSSSGYYKSAFYGTYSAGVRSPWRFGNLNYGVTTGGLACETGYNAPSASYWYGVPWLTGAEKKRGEWLGGNA